MTLIMTDPFHARKAAEYAKTASCPRCRGFILVESCYETGSLCAEVLYQFRCIECGWRDDTRALDQLATRELERQRRRQQEHQSFSKEMEPRDAA